MLSLAEDGARDDAPWTRADRRTLAFLLVSMLASLPWLVHGHHECSIEASDAAGYILCAKSLVGGDGYAYLGRPFTLRPPGLSVLIAPLIAWRGVDFLALNVLIHLFGVAMIALLFALIRPRIGWWLAAWICGLLWLNPEVQRFSNQVMSDVPGAASALGCLLLARWSDRRESLARELVLGSAIAAACYVRSINALLIPAIVVARGWGEWRAPADRRAWRTLVTRRVLPFAACAVALLAPWSLRNQRYAPPGPVDQNFVHSYSTGMWHADPSDPGSRRLSLREILARARGQLASITTVIADRLQSEEGTFGDASRENPPRFRRTRVLAGALGLLALAILALRRHRASEWLALFTTGVLALYFGFQSRLVLPIFVLAVPALVELSRELLSPRIGARRAGLALAAMLFLAIVVDFGPRRDWDAIAARHRFHADFCADVARRLPADARLGALLGWHYSLFLDRPVYSLIVAMKRSGGMDGAWKVVEDHRLNTLIAAPLSQSEQQLIEILRTRFPTESTVGGGIVARVRP